MHYADRQVKRQAIAMTQYMQSSMLDLFEVFSKLNR